MNYYEHHLGDYMRDTAHLSILEDGTYRRLIDAYYIKEAPLPNNLREVCRLVRAQTKPERDAVEIILKEFFIETPEGWRHKRCDVEIEKFQEKQPKANEKRENDKERQQRARERRKALFEALSSLGVTMPWNASTEQLQTELSRIQSQAGHAPVTEHVTRDNTATQTPDTRHQYIIKQPVRDITTIVPNPVTSPHALVCIELKKLGIQDINPSNPDLLSLVSQGVTPEEFVNTTNTIHDPTKRKFKYILAKIRGEREAAASKPDIQPKAEKPWFLTASGITKKGMELGTEQQKNEAFPYFKQRVFMMAKVTDEMVMKASADWGGG